MGLWEEDYSGVKKGLEELQKSGVSDFRDYFEKHPEKLVELINSIRVIDVNQEVLRIHGAKTKEELLGSLEKITVPEALPVFREAILAIAEGKDSFESEVPGQTLQGKKIYTIIRFIIPKKYKHFKNLIVTTLDITKRKRLEETLQKSRERYIRIFENAMVSLWEEDYSEVVRALNQLKSDGITDLNSYLKEHKDKLISIIDKIKIINVNRETLRIFKAKTKGELIGDIKKIFSEDSIDDFRKLFVAIAEGKQFFESVSTAKTLTGEKLTIKLNIAIPQNESDFKNLIISIVDLTEYNRMEERLIRSQKLESLGLLAGGIAHDFNNILTAILGNVSLLKLELGSSVYTNENEMLEILGDIENSIIKAKGLTKQLLTFSRGGMPIKKPTDMKRLIKEASEIASLGSKIKVNISAENDLWYCNVDESQITQVISNIIINAKEAMPNGGIINIRLSNYTNTRGTRYVKIEIEDTGCGIKREYIDKIFDPYFTTKPTGNGLGLAITYSIIKKHNGNISVSSREGKGTLFTILLEATERPSPFATPTSEGNNEKPPTSEEGKTSGETKKALKPQSPKARILIMDDNPYIRNTLSRILEKLGFETATTRDGEELIERYKQSINHKRPFDLLIMDLTIPGKMGGREAIKEILKINPHANAIVSSGYSQNDVLSHYQSFGFKGILKKPYTIKEIKSVVDSVLREGEE